MVSALGWANVVISLAGVALALGLAFAVHRADRARRANRLLAGLLLLQALLQVTLVAQFFRPDLEFVVPFVLTADALLIANAAAFILFCGTLRSPWTRALSTRGGKTAVIAVALLVAALDYVRLLRGDPIAAGETDAAAWLSLMVASVVALVLSVHAFIATERGSAAHKRSLAFMLAFGARDGVLGAAIAAWGLSEAGLLPPIVQAYAELASGLALLVFVPLLAYGILSTQLFDIDLRVKWGIRSGTVASIFVGGFFAVYKVTEFYLGQQVGWIFGGVLSGVFFFLAPRLNKFADGVANKAMPKVQPTSEYVSYKKLEVYRAAVESALEGDGVIDAPERAMLDRLRAKLGLSAADADALETELATPA